MALIAVNIYHIEVNHFKYEIIWQNIQEKISDICLRSGSEYPWQASSPPDGRVPSGRIFRSEPQHMTYIISL
jgi:hypothetical protein